jgi:beta-glucosidase
VCRESLVPQTRIEFDAAGNGNWWYDRLAANRRQIAESGGKIDLVFMGDSITHYWDVGEGPDTSTEIVELRKKFSILNCGYGGDQTQHLLWRAKHGELDGYEAKLVMLLIGTNNSGAGRPPEEIFAAICEIMDVIHAKQPKAIILLLPLFPRGTANSPANVRNLAVNALIRETAWGDHVIVKDLTGFFHDEKGDTIPELFDDERLHMSDAGFVVWRREVEPIFDEVCRTC